MPVPRTQIDAIVTKIQGTRDLSAGGISALKEVLHGINSGAIPDAPSDGDVYGRQDGDWVVVSGGGSSANSKLLALNFGDDFSSYAETPVYAPWVTSSTYITVTPLDILGEQMEIAVLSFQPVVSAITDGVGFTIGVYTPVEARGTYYFNCVGV